MKKIMILVFTLAVGLYAWNSYAFYHKDKGGGGYEGGMAVDSDGEVVIHSPEEGSTVSGAKVKVSFEIVDKGKRGDHIHIFLDNELLKPVYGKSYTIKRLEQGRHTITVRLASKSHVILGPKAEVKVIVK